MGNLVSGLDLYAIDKNDGWCDLPTSPVYNRPVNLPFSGSHEQMFRDDHLYDVCIVLDYNMSPRAQFRGSAIFFHLTSSQEKPTEGCIAIDRELMKKLLPLITPSSEIVILA